MSRNDHQQLLEYNVVMSFNKGLVLKSMSVRKVRVMVVIVIFFMCQKEDYQDADVKRA